MLLKMVEGYNILTVLKNTGCDLWGFWNFQILSLSFSNILKILSLTVLLLLTTTARKMDLDQGNWRNFEERANLNFKSSLYETNKHLSLNWALKLPLFFLNTKCSLKATYRTIPCVNFWVVTMGFMLILAHLWGTIF